MLIELQNVRKSYGRLRALDGVSCVIEPGQVVAVLGANGAGKSTLLRCLGAVIAPERGTVRFDHEPLRRDRLDLRRRFMLLPDFPLAYPSHTVVRHVGLVLRVYEADTTGAEERVIELLRAFDLLPLARRPLGALSRGQFYKAALVALMTLDPEVWLLDEPFASGMDPHGINAFRAEAARAAKRGRTIIYSTQILEVAERFADRVMVLQEGELRAWNTLAALRAEAGDAGPLEHLFRQLRAGETNGRDT